MDVRVADLIPLDHFQIPPGKGVERSGMKSHVIEIGPSLMREEHRRLVVETKKSIRKILVLPDDYIVHLLWREAVTTDTKCRCTNHLGRPKMAYKSREDAASGILHHHIRHGEHRIYPCPTQEGRFHVTSKKARVHRPQG